MAQATVQQSNNVTLVSDVNWYALLTASKQKKKNKQLLEFQNQWQAAVSFLVF